MGAMGVTGVVTGLLTLGSAAGSYVERLVVATMAFTFIMIQERPFGEGEGGRPRRRNEPPTASPQPRSAARQRGGRRKRDRARPTR